MVYFYLRRGVSAVSVNFISNAVLLLFLLCACGVPEGGISSARKEEQWHAADGEQGRNSYRLELSKVVDVAVGEKFYVAAALHDCAGRVLTGEAATAEIALHIRDGDEYSPLATVKAREGVAHFYVMMQKAGNNYVLQAEAEIAGETVVALSGPFNSP